MFKVLKQTSVHIDHHHMLRNFYTESHLKSSVLSVIPINRPLSSFSHCATHMSNFSMGGHFLQNELGDLSVKINLETEHKINSKTIKPLVIYPSTVIMQINSIRFKL